MRITKMRKTNDGIRTDKNLRGKFVVRRKFKICITKITFLTQKHWSRPGVLRRYLLGK